MSEGCCFSLCGSGSLISVVRWCTVGRDLQVWVVGFLITSMYLRCWDTALIGASF